MNTFISLNRDADHLELRGNYSAASIMKLVHWPLMGGWAVTFGTAKRGLDGAAARPGLSSLYQM